MINGILFAFLLGVFVGSLVGMFVMGLLAAAKGGR